MNGHHSAGTLPHVIIFLEQRIVLHCPLLELNVNAATVNTDNAPDSTVRVKHFNMCERHGEKEKEREA